MKHVFTLRSLLRGALPLAAITLIAIVLRTATANGQQSAIRVARASDFVNSIGVVSHFDYWGTPYNAAWDAISRQLVDSGIEHIRDGSTDHAPRYLSRLAFLAAHGVDHSAIFATTATIPQVRDMLTTFGPSVDFVEPQNEYNASHDPNWATTISNEQRALFDAVHGDPQFKNITVLGPSLNFAQYYASLGPLDQYEDAGNLHSYPCDLNPGTEMLHFGLETNHRLIRASTQTKPIWTTETGYGDDLTLKPQCGLPDAIIAKYVPRAFAVHWLAGEPRTYFYQLADMPTDRRFGKLGLLDAEGNPKPQFTALRELIRVLRDDPHAAFSPKPIDVDVDVEPQSAQLRTILLQKSDRTYDLLVWQEVPSMNWRTLAPIDVAPSDTTVRLGSAFADARLFTYDASWHLQPKAIRAGGGSFRFPVGDTIEVLEFGSNSR